MTSRCTTGRRRLSTTTSRRPGLEEPKAALFQSVDPAGRRLPGRAQRRSEGNTSAYNPGYTYYNTDFKGELGSVSSRHQAGWATG